MKILGAALGAAIASTALVGIPAYGATAEASDTASWIATETNGGIVQGSWGPDYGLTLDGGVALIALGGQDTSARQSISAVEAAWSDYTTGEAYGDVGSTYAGATGKLVTAATLAGDDPSNIGGVDLLSRLEATVQPSGRATDTSAWGDYSNGIGQSWVVRGLALNNSALASNAANYLLSQQCSDGAFPIQLDAPTCQAHWDATAFTIVALIDARNHGVTGLDGAIASATAALVNSQNADGSWTDSGTENANTTGLAVYALSLTGSQSAAVTEGRAWLNTVRVPAATSGPLSSEIGAIAYSQDAYANGTNDGITDTTRDQWQRSTFQAALGFAVSTPGATDPGTNPTAAPYFTTVPASVGAGEDIVVVVEGFTPGVAVSAEIVPTVSTAGVLIAGGATALSTDAVGRLSFTIAAPSSPGSYTLRVASAAQSVEASLTVTAAAGATSPTAVGSSSVGSSMPNGGAGAVLPSTGSSVDPALIAVALGILLAGSALVWRRRTNA